MTTEKDMTEIAINILEAGGTLTQKVRRSPKEVEDAIKSSVRRYLVKRKRFNIEPELLPHIRKMYDPKSGDCIYVFMPVGEMRRGLELGRIVRRELALSNGKLEVDLLRKLFAEHLTYEGLAHNFRQTYCNY